MAGIKISQLDSGGSVASTDQIPVARDGVNTLRIPASQFVTDGTNVGVGQAQFFSDKLTAAGSTLKFRTLSADEGLSVKTVGDTVVISASGQNPSKTSFISNGSTTTWSINDAKSVNPNNYRVTIDGVTQEPNADYTINLTNSTINFTSAPPLSAGVVVVSNNLVRAYDIIPSDASVTTNKIALSAVTTDTINNNAVTTEKINTGAVTNARIAYDGGSFCFRNKIINGDMRIDQRNAGAAVTVNTGSPSYTVDRFYAYQNSPSTGVQVSRSTTAPTGFLNSIKWGRNGSGTAGGITVLGTVLETANSYDLAGQTVTLSFYAKAGTNFSSTGSNLNVKLITGTGTDESTGNMVTFAWTGTNNAINANTTLNTNWQRYTYTTTLANSIKQVGLYLNWTTVGVAGADDNVYITGIQLEAGPTATPFEYRPIGTELALCQRYYEKSFNLDTAPTNGANTTNFSTNDGIVNVVVTNGNWGGGQVKFMTTKRTVPNITLYGNSNGYWGYATGNTGITFSNAVGAVGRLGLNGYVTSQQVVNNAFMQVAGHWAADAEL